VTAQREPAVAGEPPGFEGARAAGESAPTHAQRVAERVHGAPPAPPIRFEGLVTRTIAFAVDAAIINAVALAVGAAVALALSILHLPDWVRTTAIAIGGVAFAVWVVGYFVTFWATTGQTPGNRILHIRVRRAPPDDAAGVAGEPGPLRPARALVRFAALLLAALPLFAGFLPILFDDRRRGLHDMLAGTVVVGVE
jgi:uncharacterized RDD family membrane protein YckC